MAERNIPIAGSEDWLFKLNRAICTLGQAEFEDSLFDLVNGAVRVDHCAVFITNNDGTAAHLFTKSKLDEATCKSLANAYTAGFYARDPKLAPLTGDPRNSPDPRDSEVTLLPHTPPAEYDAAYRARFFTETGLIDKVSSLLRSRRYTIYCSFYRLKDSGRFRQAEFDQLSRILPLLTNLIFKHSRLAGLKEQEGRADPLITQVPLGRSAAASATLLDSRNGAFARLTDREREVCLRILQGFTSEAISLDLGVAISTIHTYRKRAYAKLGISSQNELFSLYLEFVPLA